MKTDHCSKNGARAFTFVELLIVLTIVAIFVGLLLPALVVNGRRKSSSIQCVNNLKNVGLAFRIFATDRGDRPGLAISVGQKGRLETAASGEIVRHFQTLSNEFGSPKILVCPADNRQVAPDFAHLGIENLSYFLGLNATETNPQGLLAGDRNLSVNGSPVSNKIIEITGQTIVQWTETLHNQRGNVVLGDGSVQQFSGRMMTERLRRMDGLTNWIVVP